eukprot:scaffold12609_cov132-Skeletonema_dohrnii-CCMP3373.AAC.6
MSDSDNDNRQSAELPLSKELAEFCKSDSISEEGIREIIEPHGLNNFPQRDYEFFLAACCNESVNEGIIQCLLEHFPAAISATDEKGQSPLHLACQCNKNVTLNIIQLLIDAAPDSVRSVNSDGRMPLHHFCRYGNANEAVELEILELFIEKCPEAVRHANNDGNLPIHIAASWSKSPAFCCMLIEAYPGSERITGNIGTLPLHCACIKNTVATVEYMYKLNPDAINHANTDGNYPIHFAILGMDHRDSPMDTVDIINVLLGCDPYVKLQKVNRMSLLHFACQRNYNDSNIEAGIQIIKAIYDAHPEAIEDNNIASNIHHWHQRVQEFVNGELVYARQAKDHRLSTTPDGNGQLPLHTALLNNARLGSIKLLIKGNPSAIRTVDTNNFAFPLHVACQHHDSTTVVQHLLGLDMRTLRAVDYCNNTILHYACLGAKYDTIALLLEKYDAVSVSKRNAHRKLPIDLLFESRGVLDRESIEYTDSVFRLLTAYPDTLMNYTLDMKQPADTYATQNGKKRKLDAVEVNGAMNNTP